MSPDDGLWQQTSDGLGAEDDYLADALRFTVKVPAVLVLSENESAHWAKRARCARALRKMSWAAARAELRIRGIDRRPALDRAHLIVEIAWPDHRHRDAHNILPTIKPCIDGAVDAGVLADDSDFHLIGPDLRPTHAVTVGALRYTDLDFIWVPR